MFRGSHSREDPGAATHYVGVSYRARPWGSTDELAESQASEHKMIHNTDFPGSPGRDSRTFWPPSSNGSIPQQSFSSCIKC